MQECEQLFYTTASIGNKSGYQITAKSTEITGEIIKGLEGYLYPIGIDPSKFTSSNSLLILKNDKIALSTVINIGIGFDNRDNTLYNHTIILEKEQFEKLEYDSRILLKYFIEKPEEHGTLNKIKIREDKIPINWEFFEKTPRNILETVLDAIFSSKKINLVNLIEKKFIPEIISILPKSMRCLSYSNVVVEPNRQNRYDIKQIRNNDKFTLEENHVKIDIDEILVFYENNDDLMLERTVKIIVEILKSKDKESLEFIHNEFEGIKNQNVKNRIKLATYYYETRENNNEERSRKFASDILEILPDFDEGIIVEYLLKIKKFLHKNDFEKFSKEIELSNILSKFDEEDINFESITRMFNSLHDWSYESRDKLLKYIIKNNLEKIEEKGTQLLIDAQYNYGEVILDNFIQNKELHKNILEMFDEKTELAIYYKKGYLENIIEKIAKTSNNLTVELLKKPIFDFNDEYDSRHYKNILKSILSNNEFLEKIEPRSLLELIKEICVRIKKVVEYEPSSGTAGTTNSNLQELTRIMNGFRKNLEYLENKKLDNQVHNEILKQKDEINLFLEKHKARRSISSLFD